MRKFLFPESEFHRPAPSSAFVRASQHQIARDHHVELVARANLQARRPIHSLLERLLSDLAKLAARSRTPRFPGQRPLARRRIAVGRICATAEGRKLAD